jgi:hypothetical protein
MDTIAPEGDGVADGHEKADGKGDERPRRDRAAALFREKHAEKADGRDGDGDGGDE